MEAPTALSARSHELLIKAGDTIYEQASVSEGAYIIIDGRVEISNVIDGKTHTIASLEAGSLLGEVGAIERTPRSVTAKALTDCKLLFIESDTFLRIFKEGDPLVRYIIETLANRLRTTYANEDENQTADGEAFYATLFTRRESVMIGADSPIVAAVMPIPVEVMSLPFKVSNSFKGTPEAVTTQTELKIPLPKRNSLSKPHFEIIDRSGTLWVRDLGSKHGTIVNNNIISRFGEEGVAQLHLGLNRIVAGSSDSSIRFLVQIPWKDEKDE